MHNLVKKKFNLIQIYNNRAPISLFAPPLIIGPARTSQSDLSLSHAQSCTVHATEPTSKQKQQQKKQKQNKSKTKKNQKTHTHKQNLLKRST